MSEAKPKSTPVINAIVCRARNLFGDDVAVLDYCRKHARKHENMLNRLADAVTHQDLQRAKSLRREVLRSWSGRFSATIRCMRRPDEGLMSLDQVIAVAEKVDPLHHCDEPVILHAVRKGPNVWRPIMISGPRRRAAQLLCADVLTAGLVPDPINYLVRGRGIEVASDRIMELIEQHEMTHFVLADIKDFFGAVDCTGAREVLPLPGPAVLHAVFVAPEVPREYSSLYSSLPSDMKPPHEAARPVLPQGSPTSQLAAELILAPTLRSLPSGEHAVVYGDDIALGARSAEEADGLMQALKEALKSHPAGPFRLSRKVIGRVCERFDFLKYRYKAIPACYGGGIRRVPSGKSYERFEERVMMITAEYPISKSEDRVDSYTGHWVQSFKRWEPHALSLFRLEGTKFQGMFAGYNRKRAKKAKEPSNGPATEPSESE